MIILYLYHLVIIDAALLRSLLLLMLPRDMPTKRASLFFLSEHLPKVTTLRLKLPGWSSALKDHITRTKLPERVPQQTDLYGYGTPSVICAKDEVILCDRPVTAKCPLSTLHAPARLHTLIRRAGNQLSRVQEEQHQPARECHQIRNVENPVKKLF